MSIKVVSIESRSPEDIKALCSNDRILSAFTHATEFKSPDKKIEISADSIVLTADRDSFVAMMDAGIMPRPISDAFKRADALLQESEAERKGTWREIFNAARCYIAHETPTIYCPQRADEFEDLKVMITAYGRP